MGIPASVLPDDSPSLQHAYDYAINTVNISLIATPSQRSSWSPYELAVYNLGGAVLLEYAQDQTFPLSSISWTTGVVTAVTTDPNTLVPGRWVSIVGVSPYGYTGPSPSLPYPGRLQIQGTPNTSTIQYNLTVNPGMATLLSNAAVLSRFFSDIRSKLKLGEFTPGVVSSSSDVSTSVGLDNPDFMKGFTIEDLGLLKTVYGRTYLAIAQKWGPNTWGLT